MISAWRQTLVAAVVVAGAMTLAPIAAHGVSAPAKSPNPLADPKSNTAPSQRFVNACRAMGTSKSANQKCDAAALHDFDAVRKKEGLGRMTLPRDFATLSVPAQLLAISDIERVDRGRRAIIGRSSALDKLAQQGANNDQDPPFPAQFPGDAGGANWAGAGNSALLDDFYWMYDDGPGSFNEDCTPTDTSGCWGHRHDILNAYDGPLLMGAAVARGTQWGTSMTEEFIGGDNKDKADVPPTWRTIAATFPPRLAISASRARVAAGHAVTVSGTVGTHSTHKAVAGELVELQRRAGTSGVWHDVRGGRTGAHGHVSFVLHPVHSDYYRLQARGPNGAPLGDSGAVRVAIG